MINFFLLMMVVFNASQVSLVHAQEFREEAMKAQADSIRQVHLERAEQLKKRILERQPAIQDDFKVDSKFENTVNINGRYSVAKDGVAELVFPGTDVKLKGESNHVIIKSNGGDHTIFVSQTGKNNTVSINQNNQIQSENKDENER